MKKHPILYCIFALLLVSCGRADRMLGCAYRDMGNAPRAQPQVPRKGLWEHLCRSRQSETGILE